MRLLYVRLLIAFTLLSTLIGCASLPPDAQNAEITAFPRPVDCLERNIFDIVARYSQRWIATPNERGVALYVYDELRNAGIAHVRLEEIPRPPSNPDNPNPIHRYVGRLAFGEGLPDIYGNIAPNNGNAIAKTEANLVYFGTFPDIQIPNGAQGPLIAAVAFDGLPNPPADVSSREQVQYMSAALSRKIPELSERLGTLGFHLENERFMSADGNLEIAGFLFADRTLSNRPPWRTGAIININQAALDALGGTPTIVTTSYFLDMAVERSDYFQYMERYIRTHTHAVLGIKPAATDEPELVIVLSAHIDSILSSPGASDNASGVAVLIELARRFAYVDLGNIELWFAAVGAHEAVTYQGGSPDGFLGSAWVVGQLRERNLTYVTIGINMDMVTSPGFTTDENGAIPRPLDTVSVHLGASHSGWGDENLVLNLPAYLIIDDAESVAWAPGITNVRAFQMPWGEHTAFADHGIDAVDLFIVDGLSNDFEAQYHSSMDNLEENYCHLRLTMIADLVTNAITKAARQRLTMQASFSFDLSSGTLSLTSTEQIFNTWEALDLTLSLGGQFFEFEMTPGLPYICLVAAFEAYFENLTFLDIFEAIKIENAQAVKHVTTADHAFPVRSAQISRLVTNMSVTITQTFPNLDKTDTDIL